MTSHDINGYYCIFLSGHDYIPFQLLDVTGVYYTSNYSNMTNITTMSNFALLPRQLDGASDAILHSGIGIGTTTQTKIYVCTTHMRSCDSHMTTTGGY